MGKIDVRALLPFLLVLVPEVAAQKVPKDQTVLLRRSPKRFVTVVSVDAKNRTLELRIEGQEANRKFVLEPDGEVKIHGWWGRLDQLVAGDRAWIWMHKAKKGEQGRIFVIADEISEQEIHGLPYEVKGIDSAGGRISLFRRYGKKVEQKRDLEFDAPVKVEVGEKVYVQTAGGKARLVLTTNAAAELRQRQRRRLHGGFREHGLPGSLSANHPFAGELEVMVDHEALRWARHQKPGAKVTLALSKPVKGFIRAVEGWHEKTRLRIAARGADLADLRLGQRIRVKVEEPPADVLRSVLPVGIGRAKGRESRIEWFLANTYCSCSISGDGCTGMFYTLASCNPKACGMPRRIRGFISERIDKGMTDEQILADLRKSRGPLCLKPHLLR